MDHRITAELPPKIVAFAARRGAVATVDALFAEDPPAQASPCALLLHAGGTVQVACYGREKAAHDAMLAGELFLDVDAIRHRVGEWATPEPSGEPEPGAGLP